MTIPMVSPARGKPGWTQRREGPEAVHLRKTRGGGLDTGRDRPVLAVADELKNSRATNESTGGGAMFVVGSILWTTAAKEKNRAP